MAPVGHFAQCGSAHRLQLIGEGRAHVSVRALFPDRGHHSLVKKQASDPSLAIVCLRNFELGLREREEIGWSFFGCLDGIYIFVAVCRPFFLSCAILCNGNE